MLLLIVAHFNSNFNSERPKPNSLVYYADLDTKKAYWKSYDNTLDNWTKPYFASKREMKGSNEKKGSFESKYSNQFVHSSTAEFYNIPLVKINKTSEDDIYNLTIKPLEKAHRITLFVDDSNIRFDTIKINNVDYTDDLKTDFTTGKSRFFTYYVVDQEPINISITCDSAPNLRVIASSYTLINNEVLGVKPRGDSHMPKPFVLNDAITNQREVNFY